MILTATSPEALLLSQSEPKVDESVINASLPGTKTDSTLEARLLELSFIDISNATEIYTPVDPPEE